MGTDRFVVRGARAPELPVEPPKWEKLLAALSSFGFEWRHAPMKPSYHHQ